MHPVRAGDVDHAVVVHPAAPATAADAGLIRGPAHASEARRGQQVAHSPFADLEHQSARQQQRHARAEVGVAAIKTRPVGRRPVVEHAEVGGIELDHRLLVAEGPARAVPSRHPDVARGIERRGITRRPYGALAGAGVDLKRLDRASPLTCRDQPAVVGAAVAIVAALADEHLARIKRQRRPLKLVEWSASRRVDHDRQSRSETSIGQVQPE